MAEKQLTPQEQIVDSMIKENNEGISLFLKQEFSKQETTLRENLRFAIEEIDRLQRGTKEKMRQDWIRQFAAGLVPTCSVDDSVKLAHNLWDALEKSFEEEEEKVH